MADVTHILSAIKRGDPHTAEQLLPLAYDELRKLAAHLQVARRSRFDFLPTEQLERQR